MRPRLVPLVLLGLAVLPLSACSDDEPAPREHAVTSFGSEQPEGGTRIAEQLRRTGDFTEEVTVPDGTRDVWVLLDCVGPSGELDVALSKTGGGTAPCATDAGSGPGRVKLSGVVEQAGTRKLSVTAPNGAEWSFAVYAK